MDTSIVTENRFQLKFEKPKGLTNINFQLRLRRAFEKRIKKKEEAQDYKNNNPGNSELSNSSFEISSSDE